MATKSHPPSHKTPAQPTPKEVAPVTEKLCQVVRDTTATGVRIVIKCEGELDIVLLDLGAHPEQPVIHATGSSNASLA